MIDLKSLAGFVIGGQWPPAEEPSGPWIQALREHRVEALAAYHHRKCDVAPHILPRPVRDCLEDARHRSAARELLQRHELARVAAVLDRAGVDAIAIKGTSLAYTAYPDAALRPRVDTDLLIDEPDVPAVTAALAALGYHRAVEPPTTLASYQLHLERPDVMPGFLHRCDIHWRLVNPQILSRTLSFTEIRETSTVISALSPSRVKAPSASLSLLIACIHRAAHHFASDTLIWLYDIHLLAGSLGEPEWGALIALARRRDVEVVLADGVLRAASLFGTAMPSTIAFDLAAASRAGGPIAGFLNRGRRLVDILDDDLRALPTWRARARLLREHVFPPAAYMRQRYGVHAVTALPALYAYRVLRGAPRWFFRGNS